MNIKLKFINGAFESAVQYIPTTIKLTLWVVLIGLFFGMLTAAVRTYRKPFTSRFCDCFVTVFKAVPVNLLIIIFHIAFVTNYDELASVFHITTQLRDVDKVFLGIIALSLPTIASMSEFIRGALLSVDKGQYEAGYTVGMSFLQIFRRIVFPQMMLVFAPSFTGIVIAILKSTSLVFVLGTIDVLNGAMIYASKYYSYFEAYLAVAFIYWGLSLMLEFSGKLVEKALGKYRKEMVK